ncbi:MAG: hypothetical protein FJ405_05010 [Verrucomicrobia bacterium]|nr:hypothetical protein [Verrucomicrobiota bacterium]
MRKPIRRRGLIDGAEAGVARADNSSLVTHHSSGCVLLGERKQRHQRRVTDYNYDYDYEGTERDGTGGRLCL